jgi:hypothetical protein
MAKFWYLFSVSFSDLPQKPPLRGRQISTDQARLTTPIAPSAACVQNYTVWQYLSFQEFITESSATLDVWLLSQSHSTFWTFGSAIS